MRRVVLLVLGLLALVTFLPTSTLAVGVAIGPTTVEIPNAVRGGEYERTVTVFNPSDPETEYALSTDGEAGTWVSLCDWNTRQAVASVTIAGRGSATILLKVNVPGDIANGSYTATVYAETAPIAGTGENGASTVLQGKSVLTVTVSDTQTVGGTVLSIQARDIEAGLPLRLEVNFRNTGNVAVTPQIDCAVNEEDVKIAEFTHAETSVTAGTQEVIRMEWADTVDLNGEYVALVTVSLADQVLDTREVPFRVLPVGTFSKTGEFISLGYEGEPTTSATLKVLGSFKSTGQADCRAKLILEVYRDGGLVDALESEESLVPVGETSILTAYLKPGRAGEYTVKGHIAYDGKQTDTMETSFTVTGGSSKTSSVLPFVIGGIGGGLVIAAAAGVVLRRRQTGARARKQYAASKNGKRYAS